MMPEGWTAYKLGELADITSSKRIFLSDYVTDGVPFYRSKEVIERFRKQSVSTQLYITKEKFSDIKKKFGAPKGGDILLTSVGTIGVPMLVRDKDYFYFKDGNLTWFRNYRTDILNPIYLYYWIQSSPGKQAIEQSKIGSTQQAITIFALKRIQIDLPSLVDQSHIASIFSSLDDKIELNLRMNKTLESIAQAIFKEWFIDFRFPGFDGELVDGLPKGWRKGTVADLLSISKNTISPSDYPLKDFYHYSIPAFDEGKSPIMERGRTILSNKFIVKQNSILISKLNPRFPRIWPVRDVNEESCICSTEFLVLQPKRVNYYSFIISFLNLHNTLSSMAGLVTGTSSSHQRIRPLDLMTLPLALPNFEVIDEYEKTVIAIVERNIRNTKENLTLIKLRDTLLPKLMTGKIKVA